MDWRRRALADWLAAGFIGAAVFAWFGHAFLNYDTFYALVWGSDLAHGRAPAYDVPVAPTPHPLAQLAGFLLTPFGAAAEDVLLGIGLLALGMLAVGLFRLGQELFGVWVGVLAAAIILTRVPILSFGIRGYVDLPTAALVVWAAVLEVRRPRRGAPVLILLALAGLLRPEAWLYAGAYWLWLMLGRDAEGARPDRIRLTALAVAGPVIWMASDLLITGSPVHSLTGTHDLAAELGRRTGITALPEVGPRRMGEILRLPEGIAALIGVGIGLAYFRDRIRIPLAVAGLNAIAYTAFAIARLPLLGRYLFVAASMLALFAAIGAVGWLEERRPPAWRPLGLAALAAIAILFGVQQVDRLDLMKSDIAARDRIQADLRDLVEQPAVKDALRACPRVYVASHRPIPLIALYADIPATRIVTPDDDAQGCLVTPASQRVADLAVLDPREPGTLIATSVGGGEGDARNASWVFSRDASIAAAK